MVKVSAGRADEGASVGLGVVVSADGLSVAMMGLKLVDGFQLIGMRSREAVDDGIRSKWFLVFRLNSI